MSKFRDPKIRSKRITIRLDSGADVTCIPKHLADNLQLDVNEDSDYVKSLRLIDAAGRSMHAFGSTEVFVIPTHGSLKNQVKKVDMVVTDSTKNSIRLSVDELTRWGLLTDVFWAACSRVEQTTNPTKPTTPAQQSVPNKGTKLDKLEAHFASLPDEAIDDKHCKLLRSLLIASFSDTFKDDLIDRPLLVGPEEKIHFIKDESVTPLNVVRPRAIPIGWRREADLLVRNLLQSKIIERVPHVTEWCSPGAFVPKPSGKGLRLVTDYRAINKHIKRPVYPFPDVNTLKINIPPTTKFLAKVDFSSGYFQVGLADESRDLTCFILPQGRFRYTRTPMGLASSGDLFV